MTTHHLTARAAELVERRVPFVDATVVRAQHPTSAHPGDAAIVLADGSIEGFVGGQCVQSSVQAAAMEVLESGEALLLRVLPADAEEYPEVDGARTVVNHCLSGGAIELFLAPRRPPPVAVAVGDTPVAAALAELLPVVGFEVRAVEATGASQSDDATSATPPELDGVTAVVVASHGHHEEATLEAAVRAGVGYVGLVASVARGKAVLDSLDLPEDAKARIRTPVGIDIGATTAQEIALSIAADLVRAVRTEGIEPAAGDAAPRVAATAVDPVCGMTVTVTPDTPHVELDGVDHWFCAPGCAEAFAAQHSAA